MAVFRVEKNKGYTVMRNNHLRNKELSLKSKGLLSQMLSLPEDWDYTLAGLSYINRESIDAIRTAVWKLEKAGYIARRQGRDEKGKMTAIEYTIYEQPQPPGLDCPVLENPTADNPILENPTTDNPTSENPMQINKDIQKTNLPKKEKSNTDISNTHSIPIHSLNSLPYAAAQPPGQKRTERNDAYQVYEEIIKDNIEYDILLQDRSLDRDRLNEIVDLMLETVCTARKKVRIAGDDYPAELVKSKFMKLDSEHIRFVLDCMSENTTKIHNIKQYLKAVLFNAPSTIDSYYTYVKGKAVPVSEEVYKAYWKITEHEKYLQRKDWKHNVMSFSALDHDGHFVDNIIDEKIDLEKIVEVKMQIEELHKALNTLTKEERELMEAIFYKEESLRSTGKKEKVSYQTIGKRRDKILEKLREILKDKI